MIQAVEQYALDCVVCIREHVTGGGPSAMAVCSAHRPSGYRLIVKRKNVANKTVGRIVSMEHGDYGTIEE